MKPLVLVLVLATLASAQTNYCDPALCPNQGPHIGCNGLTTLSSNCGVAGTDKFLNGNQQALVLDLHNRLRSKVAMGQQESPNGQYPSAARMATMRWDPELANLAAANVRRCQYGHDKCRNTAQFPSAGQNIATFSFQGADYADDEIIRNFVNDWYSEYAVANPSFMTSYPKGYSGPAIGHFTQIVADRATAIGCAMVRYVDGEGWTNQDMVCNYAITTIVNQPVYVVGAPCSKCTTGCNSQYPGLCNPEENVVPRP